MEATQSQSSGGWVLPLVTTVLVIGAGIGGYIFYKKKLIDDNVILLGHEGKRFKEKADVLSIPELMKVNEYLAKSIQNKDWEKENTAKLNAEMSAEDKKKGLVTGSGTSPEFKKYMTENGKEIGLIMAKVNAG